MATNNSSKITFDNFCDWVIVLSLSASVFVLPASIAYLNSFAVLGIFFYFIKKIGRIIIAGPLPPGTAKWAYIWKGLAPRPNVLNTPLQFLIVAFLISVCLSHYPKLSWVAFFGKFLKCVFLYLSFIEAFTDKKRVWVFMTFFMTSAAIVSLSGIVQHYTGKDFLKGHLLMGDRVNACLYTANGFGAYLLPIIGLVTHMLFTVMRRKAWGPMIALSVFLFSLLICLCWTYSRSAWIGYLIVMTSMVVIDNRKSIFALILAVVFIFVFLPSLNEVRNLYLINDNSGGHREAHSLLYSLQPKLSDAGSGRSVFWKNAIDVIRLSPIWGTGLNTYIKYVAKDCHQTLWYAHNCYLQMAAETGILGLGCFLWLLAVLFRYGLIGCQVLKDDWTRTLLQGTICGLLGFMAQSLFDNTFYTVQLGMLMWLLFGLLIASTRLKELA